MDKLDWKILNVLDWKGREPISKIAKKVKSNKDVVSYRIKKLEENKTIVRYFPVLDMHRLGYFTSRLYFDLEEINQESEDKFISFLDKEIGAGIIFRMDYPYRYGIVLWTKSIYEVKDIIFKIKRNLGKFLLSYVYTLFCEFKIYPKDYLFGKKFHEEFYGLKPTTEMVYNDLDFQILRELAKNARISTVQIAETLNVPQTTISHKIKNLESKGVIIGYRAEINSVKLGYLNYFLEIYLEDNNNIEKIEGWADTNKNVVWLQKIVGTCDIEIEVEVKDRGELETLLNKLRHKFPNIRKIVFWSQDYKKLTFLP